MRPIPTDATDIIWRESDTGVSLVGRDPPGGWHTSVGWWRISGVRGGSCVPEAVERRHRLTVLRVIVVAELVVALLTGASVVFAYNHVDKKITTGPAIGHIIEPRTKSRCRPRR